MIYEPLRVDDDMTKLKHENLTEKIIGAAYTVHNELGFGFSEKVCHNALKVELENIGLRVEQEKPVKVFYRDINVGDYLADLVVEDKIILELKAVKSLNEAHEAQLINYLSATRLEVGLLINFGEKVQIKRKLYTL
jgi:GxxExxY protein